MSCCICLEDISTEKHISRCNHCTVQIHTNCLKTWLLNSPKCPICGENNFENIINEIIIPTMTTCVGCDKQFKNENGLKIHQSRMKCNVKILEKQCNFCGHETCTDYKKCVSNPNDLQIIQSIEKRTNCNLNVPWKLSDKMLIDFFVPTRNIKVNYISNEHMIYDEHENVLGFLLEGEVQLSNDGQDILDIWNQILYKNVSRTVIFPHSHKWRMNLTESITIPPNCNFKRRGYDIIKNTFVELITLEIHDTENILIDGVLIPILIPPVSFKKIILMKVNIDKDNPKMLNLMSIDNSTEYFEICIHRNDSRIRPAGCSYYEQLSFIFNNWMDL